MSLSPSVRKSNVFRPFGLAVAFALASVCLNLFVVRPQNPAPTVTGRTATVNLIPWGRVNAGPFVFTRDADHDGMSDECEAAIGSNPNNPADADLDPDADGLTNGDECALGTNPLQADTDGDGFNDGLEVQQGYDPLDPNSHPPAGVGVVSIAVTPARLNLNLNPLVPQIPVQLTVTGTLSDGSTVDLTRNPATSYLSLAPSVAVVDDFGSVAAVGVGFTTIRVRNASLTADVPLRVEAFTPQPVGMVLLPGYANAVDVVGRYAFIACGLAGLVVVDVADPADARVVASLPLPGLGNDVRVIGNFAYVAAGVGGLQVVDVSVPTAPVKVGEVVFPNAVEVAVKGDFAYVAAAETGLHVVNVGFPSAPFEVGLWDTVSVAAVDADPARDLVVAVVPNGLRVLDVTNPTLPTERGAVTLPRPLNVTAAGTFAYASGGLDGGTPGLTTVDFTNPDAPTASLVGGVSYVGTDFKVRNGMGFGTALTFPVATSLLFGVTNPGQPVFAGSVRLILDSRRFTYGLSVTATDSHVYQTAADQVSDGSKGVSGPTALLIAQYRRVDAENNPPTVELIAPRAGTVLVAGEQIRVQARAADDVSVQTVTFTANGTPIGTDATSPYSADFTVPSGAQVTFGARATDWAGNTGDAEAVTLSVVLDPLTTIVGRATDLGGTPIAGATATLDGTGRTTTTDAGGQFSFADVPTVPFGAAVSVTVDDATGGRQGRSGLVTTVRGGTTDVGTIRLSRNQLTLLPSVVSALGVGDYTADSVNDLFVGFSDRPSSIYNGLGDGKFSPSANYPLPFGAVRSGVGLQLNQNSFDDVLAQPFGQSGNATAVLSDGGTLTSEPFPTGLAGECDAMVVNRNNFGEQILGFLKTTGGTQLTARVGDVVNGFGPPISIPVALTLALRSLTVVDLTNDNVVDLAAVETVAEDDVRLIVWPRTSPTTFGPPVESQITVRSVLAGVGTIDFSFSDFDGNGVLDVAVLGDDRVRIYAGDGTGRFGAIREIALPAGVLPLGVAALNTDGSRLTVVWQDAPNSTGRTFAFLNGGELGDVVRYQRTSASGDVRIVFGKFDNQNNAPDAAIVEGDSITTILDVGPAPPEARQPGRIFKPTRPHTAKRTIGFLTMNFGRQANKEISATPTTLDFKPKRPFRQKW